MAERKPKLCLITTGGTIGMVRDANGMARPPESQDDFEAMLEPLFELYDIGIVSFPPRDSTDMTPDDWFEIYREVIGISQEVDGFVIAHGTDTMPYAAATLAFTLGPPPLARPVILTGAQRTPDDADYDGMDNLQAACEVAASDLGEVAIVFHGRILRGCRAEKISLTQLDAFRSPEPGGLGRVSEAVGLHDDAVRKNRLAKKKGFPAGLGIEDEVLSIALTPGLPPYLYAPVLEQEDGVKGVILQTYGAGNIPNRDEENWLSFVRVASERDIPVLLTQRFGLETSGTGSYELARLAVAAGGIPCSGMTPAAAEIKFRYAIATALTGRGSVVELVREHMATSYFGERGGSPQPLPSGV